MIIYRGFIDVLSIIIEDSSRIQSFWTESDSPIQTPPRTRREEGPPLRSSIKSTAGKKMVNWGGGVMKNGLMKSNDIIKGRGKEGVKLQNLWNKIAQNQLHWMTIHDILIITLYSYPPLSTQRRTSLWRRDSWGWRACEVPFLLRGGVNEDDNGFCWGGGVKLEYYWDKKAQINSIGWHHTRVDNNKTNKRPGQSLLNHRISSRWGEDNYVFTIYFYPEGGGVKVKKSDIYLSIFAGLGRGGGVQNKTTVTVKTKKKKKKKSQSQSLLQHHTPLNNRIYWSSPENPQQPLYLVLHFCSKKTCKISIVFEDLSRNSVFLQTVWSPGYTPIHIPRHSPESPSLVKAVERYSTSTSRLLDYGVKFYHGGLTRNFVTKWLKENNHENWKLYETKIKAQIQLCTTLKHKTIPPPPTSKSLEASLAIAICKIDCCARLFAICWSGFDWVCQQWGGGGGIKLEN